MTQSQAPEAFSGHIVRPWRTGRARQRGSNGGGHLEKATLCRSHFSVRQKKKHRFFVRKIVVLYYVWSCVLRVFCACVRVCPACACLLCVSVCVCACVCVCVCGFTTPPCVLSKRPRVCRHQAHMFKHVCAWCRYTQGSFERTHGRI